MEFWEAQREIQMPRSYSIALGHHLVMKSLLQRIAYLQKWQRVRRRANEKVHTSYATLGDYAWILWRPLVSAGVWILFVSSTVHCWRGLDSLGGVFGAVQRKQVSLTESKRNIPEAAGRQCPGCWLVWSCCSFMCQKRIQESSTLEDNF